MSTRPNLTSRLAQRRLAPVGRRKALKLFPAKRKTEPAQRLPPREPTPAELLASQIDVHVGKREFPLARARLGELEQIIVAAESITPEDAMKMTVAEIGLPLRTVNAIESLGAIYVRDLLQLRRKELMAIPQIGATAIADIYGRLESYGLAPQNYT